MLSSLCAPTHPRLHIGTNDLLQNGYPTAAAAAADMIGQMAELLAVIKSVAPRTTVYVASIISFAAGAEHAVLNEQAGDPRAVWDWYLVSKWQWCAHCGQHHLSRPRSW